MAHHPFEKCSNSHFRLILTQILSKYFLWNSVQVNKPNPERKYCPKWEQIINIKMYNLKNLKPSVSWAWAHTKTSFVYTGHSAENCTECVIFPNFCGVLHHLQRLYNIFLLCNDLINNPFHMLDETKEHK